jgi:hypothetical protein
MANTCIFLYTGSIKRPIRIYSPTEMERCNVPHVAFRSISGTSIDALVVGMRFPPQQGRMGRVVLKRRATMAIRRKVASQARQAGLRRHSHLLTRMVPMATMVLMEVLETPRRLQDMARPRNKAHLLRMNHTGKGNTDNQRHPVAMGSRHMASPRRRVATANPMANPMSSPRRRIIRWRQAIRHRATHRRRMGHHRSVRATRV